MKSTIIKWNENMAARCIEKYQKVYKQTPVLNQEVDIKQELNEEPASIETDVSEWDDFEKAINRTLTKKTNDDPGFVIA